MAVPSEQACNLPGLALQVNIGQDPSFSEFQLYAVCFQLMDHWVLWIKMSRDRNKKKSEINIGAHSHRLEMPAFR